MYKNKIREISIMGILIALAIVFSRVLVIAYPPGQVTIKISAYFITPLIGIWFGPIRGLIAGIIIDLLGFVLFPSAMPYHIGFTINEALQGFLPGLIFLCIKKYKPNQLLVVPLILVTIALLPFGINYILNRNGLTDFQRVVFIICQCIAVTTLLYGTGYSILKNKNNSEIYSLTNVILCVLPVKLLVSYILSPIWLSSLYKKSFIVYLPVRFIVSPINIFLAIALLYVVVNRMSEFYEEYISNEK